MLGFVTELPVVPALGSSSRPRFAPTSLPLFFVGLFLPIPSPFLSKLMREAVNLLCELIHFSMQLAEFRVGHLG